MATSSARPGTECDSVPEELGQHVHLPAGLGPAPFGILARMAITVRPLTIETFGDLDGLFTRDQGNDASWCWCMHFRTSGSDSLGRGHGEENRTRLEALTAASNLAPGLVAYDGDDAVGWVSLGPRADYPRVDRSRLMAPVDDVPAWVIACFVVAANRRGQGIGHLLLEAAIGFARSNGAVAIEGYPRVESDGRVSTPYTHAGTPALFERAGFFTVAERRTAPGTTPRLVMRLELATA